MFKVDDRIYETSITVGAGDYTLAGAEVGHLPVSSIGANNYGPFWITDDTNWEVIIGRYLAGPDRLSRTTVLRSSNGNAAVNWAAGKRKIRCGLPAAMGMPRMLSESVAGAANVALTQDEQRRDVLVFTGALTGNIDVTVDATVWEWTVYNNTSGAFTLTFKVAGAAGVTIQQGKSTQLRSDGINVVNSIDYLSALAVGGLLDLSGAGAGQIKFPATQNASANANTLDDYEEGTFTPSAGNQTVVGAFSSSGEYVKKGREVTIQATASGATSIAGASTTFIGSLPFTVAARSVGKATNDALSLSISMWFGGGSTSVYICGGYGATPNLFFSGTYFV